MFWIEDCYWRADCLHGGSWQIEVFPLEVFLSPLWKVTTQRMSCRLFRFVFYLVTGLWPLPQIIEKQPGTREFNGLWCGPFAQPDRSVLAHGDYCIPLALFNLLLCVCLSIMILDLWSDLGIFCCWRVRVVVLNSASNNTRRKPPTYRKSLTHFITLRYIEYTSPWAWFELTTLVVIVSLIIVYICCISYIVITVFKISCIWQNKTDRCDRILYNYVIGRMCHMVPHCFSWLCK
jgi:hypothetical protein